MGGKPVPHRCARGPRVVPEWSLVVPGRPFCVSPSLCSWSPGGPRIFSYGFFKLSLWSPGGPRIFSYGFFKVSLWSPGGPRVFSYGFFKLSLWSPGGSRVFFYGFSSFLPGPRVAPASFPMVFSSFLSGPQVVPAFFPMVFSKCVQGNRALGCRLGTSDFFPHLHDRSVFIDIRTSIAVAVGLLAPLISVQHEGPFLDP